MQTILVPLDGSALAEQALPFVRLLALALHARVALLHVVTDAEHEYSVLRAPEAAPANSAALWERAQYVRWQERRCEVQAYLEARAAPLVAAGISVVYDIEAGLPAANILQVAQRRNATLLALTSHGHGRLRRWATGSVAELIAQHSDFPILLVRAGMRPPGGQLRRILAPLDGSVSAGQVLAHALALAHSACAELVVLQTIAPSIEDLIGTHASLEAQRASLATSVQHAYTSHFGTASAGQATITAVISLGSPRDAILEEAAQRPADLIVLVNQTHADHHHRPSQDPLDTIFRAVDAPLLLVPPR